MNILCISKDLSIGDLAYRLKKEGHSVRLFIEDKNQKHNFQGLVERVEDWRKSLKWVGKKGLILFDSIGYGKIQDDLRQEGYLVVGGSQGADRLENDRQFGQKILSACGIKIVPSMNFSSVKEAIKFAQKNKGPWVVKQNGYSDKSFNYVGKLENNQDTIEVLKNYFRHSKKECYSIDLQKKIEGVEIGAGRYFNGKDWVGPIEINMEHKNLFNGDLGPKTFEMGTLMWYTDNEKNRLFQETLAKLKAYLEKINFRGDAEINCIVNQDKVHPLEVTARFGFPAIHLQEEIHTSPWGEFLKAVAAGQEYKLKYKEGFGIIVLVATPPFPYEVRTKKYYPSGINILFRNKITEKEREHIHWEEVSRRKRGKALKIYISSKTGFVLNVTGIGKTVEEARERTYKLINKIVIPKMFYRTDIGLKFIQEDQAKLKKWGWV